MGAKPTKDVLAKIQVLSDQGKTPYAIGKQVGLSNHTVSKYLAMDLCSDDYIREMVEIIKKHECDDLYLLGQKARKRLHELVDKGDSAMIPTIALMDRSFQQRRLLEGEPTEYIDMRVITAQLEDLRRRRAALDDVVGESEDQKGGETE